MPDTGARFFTDMQSRNRSLWTAFLIGMVFAIYCLTRPWVIAAGGDMLLLAFPAEPEDVFSIRFIHSVQKTPVIENFCVNDDQRGIRLVSTKYQSFGVGLPFLASDGVFRQEGDYFVMDHMDRNFARLELRTGVGTDLTFFYKEQAYPVYQSLPPGSKIVIEIVPYYRKFWQALL